MITCSKHLTNNELQLLKICMDVFHLKCKCIPIIITIFISAMLIVWSLSGMIVTDWTKVPKFVHK